MIFEHVLDVLLECFFDNWLFRYFWVLLLFVAHKELLNCECLFNTRFFDFCSIAFCRSYRAHIANAFCQFLATFLF
jgi:hypothetical protein